MTQLPVEEMLYLLYAVAYSNEGTVTQGLVKEHLSKEHQKNAEQIYKSLEQQKLIESPKRSRFSVTDHGKKVLVANLQITDYEFDTSKGQRVLNALLYCFKLTSPKDHVSTASIEDMEFDTFVEKFKKLYFEDRKQQELRGVVAIRSHDICQKFMEHNLISRSQLDRYFGQLKSNGLIIAVTEKDDELIRWVE